MTAPNDPQDTTVSIRWMIPFVRVTGVGRASGAEFDIRIAHLWTLRDGMVVRGEGYGDRDRALDAAGLGEHQG